MIIRLFQLNFVNFAAMCYLPKVTFYVYFGFFFLGYLWIFGLLFFRTVSNSDRNKLDPQPPHRPVKSSDVSNLQSIAIFPLKQTDVSGVEESRCVLTSRRPQFHVCTHNPTKDTGVSATIHLQKDWETDLSNAILEELKKFFPSDTLFVDIGANIGWYSLLVSTAGYNVVAVEPFEDNLVLLAKSVVMNNSSGTIRAVRNALSDRQENLTFVDQEDNFGGRFSLRTEADRFKFQNFHKLYATAVQLDDLVTLLQSDDPSVRNVLLKMDIQGDECRVLRAADRFFNAFNVAAVFMEWEETRKLEDRRCVLEMIEKLSGKGADWRFQPYSLTGTKITLSLDSADLSLPQNLVWRRPIQQR